MRAIVRYINALYKVSSYIHTQTYTQIDTMASQWIAILLQSMVQIQNSKCHLDLSKQAMANDCQKNDRPTFTYRLFESLPKMFGT